MKTFELLPFVCRVNFYESCLAELKKELGKYVRHHADTNKVSKSLTKVLRNAASAERNKQLQSFLFLQAQKYETLDGDRDSLVKCSDSCELMIDDAKKMLVSPLRDVLGDYAATKKKAAQLNDPRLTSDIERTLPVHSEMFEVHRVKSVKTLLATVLAAELKYHCRAVEEISSALAALKEIPDEIEQGAAAR